MTPAPPKYRDRLLAAAYRLTDTPKRGRPDGSLAFLDLVDTIIEEIEASCQAEQRTA